MLEEQELHTANIELMVALKRACKPELVELCGYNASRYKGGCTGSGCHRLQMGVDVHNTDAVREVVAPFATCLRTQPMEALRSAECRERVRSLQLAASEDIRFNPQLDKACATEQARLCADVPPGGGRRIACLEAAAQRGGAGGANFSADCHGALLSFQSKALAHVRGHWPVVSACAAEMESFCAAALEKPQGHARHPRHGAQPRTTVLDCLQGSTNRAGFGAICLGAVRAATAVQLSDMHAVSPATPRR